MPTVASFVVCWQLEKIILNNNNNNNNNHNNNKQTKQANKLQTAKSI